MDILKNCEQELKQILWEAASSGDYEPLMQVTEWARKVAALVGDAERASFGGERSDEIRASNSATQRPTSPPQGRRRKPSAHRSEYPKFAKRGDFLVKIAWSRKQKREYQHKAPRQVVLLVVTAVARAGQDGRIMQMGNLLPIKEQDGSEIPSYQPYLTLAWLKKTGLVDQHGRQGYSVPKPDELRQEVESEWNALSHIR